MIGFRPVTRGEWLYTKLVELFIDDQKALQSAVGTLRGSALIGNRAPEFADYVAGLYCFNLTARLIKTAQALIAHDAYGEALYRSSMLSFLANHCGISEFRFGRPNINALINLSIEAAFSSGKTISQSVKNGVATSKQQCYCYICGIQIFVSGELEETSVQYEHIWPSSFGGDSIIENLLPACPHCNNAKGSMLLWQDGPVHSFILPPNPSANDITTINRRAKIAWHRKAIFELAISRHTTLKEAAITHGPVDFSASAPVDLDDASDFFTIHF
ncbi:HNH endonuclease [Herbaspirillum sp. WGmk3]|uniref:HNH endonuclease n=1 Tax=Herbaspirillum sp. WGmk3 TaxID=2919925 RepID=UPI002091DC65|nr:HNH endonuclease [Herbaspirillum sp. WGmk3]MCO4856058.1 HNH endonuclease [Herbaspirillum sp. WGmk3]